MDLALYIETFESPSGEQIVGSVGAARFDLMGNQSAIAERFSPLFPPSREKLEALIGEAERVWVGPRFNEGAELLSAFGLTHPQLRDAETLFAFIPHLPHEYPLRVGVDIKAKTMVRRIRSCIDALLAKDL